MSASKLGNDLAEVEPRQIVTLQGYPEGETSDWHVNKAVQIGGSSTGDRLAIIMQKADASEHWVTAIIDETDDGWEVDTLSGFKGEPPKGMSADEHGDAIDPESVKVIEASD